MPFEFTILSTISSITDSSLSSLTSLIAKTFCSASLKIGLAIASPSVLYFVLSISAFFMAVSMASFWNFFICSLVSSYKSTISWFAFSIISFAFNSACLTFSIASVATFITSISFIYPFILILYSYYKKIKLKILFFSLYI